MLRKKRQLRKSRLVLLAFAFVGLFALSLMVNWLLIPWKVMQTFGEGDAPPANAQITVATWNVCHARGDNDQPWPIFEPGKRNTRLAEMAKVLAEAKVDIVVLNECTFASTGVGGPNQAAYLADKLGLKWRVEQKSGDVWALCLGHQWGNAVLSRFPILSAEFIELPQLPTWGVRLGLKRKNAVEARIDLSGGKILRVFATHLPVGKGSEALRLQSAEIIEERRAASPEPLLVAGDLNDTPQSPPLALLLRSGHWQTRSNGLTFPSSEPKKKIDWILAHGTGPLIHQHSPSSTASDHLPVIAALTLQSPYSPGAPSSQGELSHSKPKSDR
jgi:endonuclease/exonuclease/phosphatase family metal-dependent hydrolase